MRKIKCGDMVKVIAGNAKGTVARVESVHGEKVVVEGVNKKVKAKKGEGHVQIDVPIHISNVMYYDEALQKAVRIHRVVSNNTRKRSFSGSSSSFI